MDDVILGSTVQTQCQNLELIRDVIRAFRRVANTYSEYSHEAVSDALTRYGIDYGDILKALSMIEIAQERLLEKSNA